MPRRFEAPRAGVPDALFVDMKAEADRLYVSYVHEDLRLSLAGFAAIAVAALIAALARRAVRARAARGCDEAGFALAGVQLTILHLVGMLLIVAVGSNYALFFCKRDDAQPVTPYTLVSLLIANLATVAGFGLLALSRVPLLETFGLTCRPGRDSRSRSRRFSRRGGGRRRSRPRGRGRSGRGRVASRADRRRPRPRSTLLGERRACRPTLAAASR